MILKIMSGETAPDSDNRKRYKLISGIARVEFERIYDGPEHGSYPHVLATFDDGHVEGIFLEGNVYVLNEQGKTIDSFGHDWIPGSTCAPEREQLQCPPIPQEIPSDPEFSPSA